MSEDLPRAPGARRVREDVALGLLGVLTVIAIGAVLYAARPIVLPLAIAWFLTYLLSPVIRFFKRNRVSGALAVAVVVVLLLGLFYLGGMFVFQRVNSFVDAYPLYQQNLADLVATLTAKAKLPIGSLGEINWTREIGTRLVAFSGSFVPFMGKSVLVLVFLVFLLLGEGQLHHKVRYAFPEERARQVSAAMTEIGRQIGRYLRVKMLISLATGVLVWAVLTVIGVDFAVTWGTLAFFLNFIPNIGSVAASIPPIVVAFLESYPSPWIPLITALSLLTIQFTAGNLVEPRLQGRSLNLSPVVLLFFLVFWGWLWGVVGMLISVPIAASVKIVCENVEPLRPIGVFMGSLTAGGARRGGGRGGSLSDAAT